MLLKHGEINPFIEKSVGGVFERKKGIVKSTYATIKYLIENRIYSLDQNFTKKDLITPIISLKDAHLVIGLDPYGTFMNLKFFSEKTVILLNAHQIASDTYKEVEGQKGKFPSIGCIIEILDQIVRRVIAFDLYDLSISLYKSEMYGPMIMLGLATKEFREILQYNTINNIIKESLDDPANYLDAFENGYNLINH